MELVYDLRNRASFRILEALLYKSPFYDRSLQTILLSETSADDRPFVLSTPRLPSPDSTELNISFDHECVDRLFQLKTRPETWNSICDFLSSTTEKPDAFSRFVSPEPPRNYARYGRPGSPMAVFPAMPAC